MGVSRRSQIRKQKQEQDLSIEDELPAQGELSLDDGIEFESGPEGQEIRFDDDPQPPPQESADSRSTSGSRRSARRSARTGSRSAAEVEAAFDASAGSSRGSARRSARASARTSARGPVSLTPEEQKAKDEAARKARKGAFILIITLLLLFGGAFAGYWFGLREKPEVTIARKSLEKAQQNLKEVAGLIEIGRCAEATALLDKTVTEQLEVEVLGRGTFDNAERAAEAGIVATDKAVKANAILNQDVPALRKAIKVKAAQLMARQGYKVLRDQYANLGRLEEDQIETFLKDIDSYCANPESPGTGSDPEVAKRYELTTIADLKNKRVDSEIRLIDLRIAKTTTVKDKYALIAQKYSLEERFTAGLSELDEAQRQHPEASLGEIREKLVLDARMRWDNARNIATQYFESYQSAGVADADRRAALDQCFKRLDKVIQNFGDANEVKPYVDEAVALLARFKSESNH